eukprot:TRINITY_DN7910_c0_g1_i1.p1 TRINITY_DN7910_c0_g1~~TRINITY_DN7910_c0_g1_i1.p1  ORF type:complete len:260 (-),score=33.72 TRINITY_DN7910_c0_g1_i1:23-802(-)
MKQNLLSILLITILALSQVITSLENRDSLSKISIDELLSHEVIPDHWRDFLSQFPSAYVYRFIRNLELDAIRELDMEEGDYYQKRDIVYDYVRDYLKRDLFQTNTTVASNCTSPSKETELTYCYWYTNNTCCSKEDDESIQTMTTEFQNKLLFNIFISDCMYRLRYYACRTCAPDYDSTVQLCSEYCQSMQEKCNIFQAANPSENVTYLLTQANLDSMPRDKSDCNELPSKSNEDGIKCFNSGSTLLLMINLLVLVFLL